MGVRHSSPRVAREGKGWKAGGKGRIRKSLGGRRNI